MSSDSVNLPVSDEVERKEDGRRECYWSREHKT